MSPHRPRFVALDFETADHGPDSACSIGLVTVENGRIVGRDHQLIRPPRRRFAFTYIHGIQWEDVRDAPTWGALWPQVARILRGAHFVAAHNAGFDAGVLRACCLAAGIVPPRRRFVCTLQLARSLWRLKPARLPDVCRHLGIELARHHDALADAEACARIVMAAAARQDAELPWRRPPAAVVPDRPRDRQMCLPGF